MPDTAPVPNIVPIPGMNQGTVVAGGSGGSGGDDANANDGGDKEGAGGGTGGDDASADNKNAPDYQKYPTCGTESHPVDVVTGRVFTHRVKDLELSGPLPLTFERSYSSTASKETQGLGWGWAHSLGWFVEVERRRVRVWNETGVSVSFPVPQIGHSVLGDWGWVLRREPWGFAVDSNEDIWRMFSVTFDEGKTFRLAAIEDRNKNRIALTYDDGKLVEIKDSAGRVVKVTSTKEGQITSFQVKNAEHHGQWIRFARYEYDDKGRLVRVQDADDFVWTYQYDEHNRLVRDTDRAGLSFCFRYDEKDRGIEAWGEYAGKKDPSLADDLPNFLADGRTRAKGIYHRKFDYHKDGYTEVTDTTETRRYYGNKKGQLDKAVSGGAVTSSKYDSRGFQIEKTDERGATTRWVRDERGRVLERIDALGRRTVIDRDPYGLPVRVVDPEGGALTAKRDQRGNVEFVTDAAGATRQLTADERGLVTLVTSANGAAERSVFDPHGNLIELHEPNGGVWQYEWDWLGRLLAVRDPLGAVTRFTYSNRGDLRSVHDPAGGTTRYDYDGERHLTQVESPKGRVTKLIWGGFHSLSVRRDANGHVVRLAYSREGELVAVINERDETHRLVYDSTGRLVEEETFDGRRLRYRNDLAGNVIRTENGAGEITAFVYDACGQLIECELSDDTKETYEYDRRGDLVRATSAAGELRMQRNAIGRVVREAQLVDGQEHWVDVTYDLTGQRIGRQSSLGLDERVERDVMRTRVRTILGGTEEIAHVNDLLGREVRRGLPAGGFIDSTFDAMGRLAQRRARTAQAGPSVGRDEPEWVGRRDDGVTAATSYLYDADGSIEAVTDRSRGVTRFEHDPVGRLLASIPERARTELFKYDPTGNLYETGAGAPDREYGKGNRLLRRGSTTYLWDGDGRLVEKQDRRGGIDRIWKYAWNGAGLLAHVETPEGKRISFTYDPFARRLQKRVEALRDGQWQVEATTRFVWDANDMTHEVSDELGTKTYLFAEDSFAPVAQNMGQEWVHLLNDMAGTPQRLLDAAGGIVGEVGGPVWGPGGEPDTRRPNQATTPLRFQGQYADEETGLFYNRYRYYDPELARFVSPDPIGPAAGLNSYGYVADPFAWVDPLGLFRKNTDAKYTTDSKGRLKSASATITKADLKGTGTGTNETSRADVRKKGCKDDDAGHLIANRLGGLGGKGFVFPQDLGTNRGAFRDHEKEIAAAVKRGDDVHVKVTLNYDGNDTRPSSITYQTTINGQKTKQKFDNP